MLLRRVYRKLLKDHFMVVQSAQTGLLMGTGDIIAQTIIEGKRRATYEPKRTAKFTLLGTVFVGPTLSLWYKVLARKIGTEMSTVVTLKKVALDQLLFAPSFLIVFLTNLNLLNGRSLSEAKEDVSSNYLDIMMANYKLWPAVQLFNFYCVPLNYQVLLAQSVAVVWNTYLSWKTNLK